ncbi:MAG: chemotaxis protein CheW [Dehalococcoidia bacterium]
MSTAGTQAPEQVVIFRVAETWYALDVTRVREIVEPGRMAVVPGAPPAVRGLATIRGSAIPVVDLAALFGGEAGTEATRVVVTSVGGGPVGLLVRDVDEVAVVDPATVQPFALPGHRVEAFRGVIQQPGRLVLWADPDALIPGAVATLARAA